MSTSVKPRKKRPEVREVGFDDLPGAIFRRLHQLAVARFTSEMGDIGLTPIQWSALFTIAKQPGIDQITLSREIFIDPSTIAGVLERLETRKLVKRIVSPDDRRVRLLSITEDGIAVMKEANEVVFRTQDWLMETLSPAERKQLMKLMLRVLKRPD